MSRSKVYRRVNLFLISLLIILDVKTQIAPRAAARTNKIKNKNISPPVVPIAAAREYLQLNAFFSNLGKKLCNIMFSLASAWALFCFLIFHFLFADVYAVPEAMTVACALPSPEVRAYSCTAALRYTSKYIHKYINTYDINVPTFVRAQKRDKCRPFSTSSNERVWCTTQLAKVEFQLFNRSYSQLTFFNFL